MEPVLTEPRSGELRHNTVLNQDFPERSRKRAIALALVSVSMAAVAVVLGYMAVALVYWEQPPGKATGRVLEAEGTWSGGGHVVIEFTTEDGQIVRFRASRDEWRVRKGEEVDIRYDPHNPGPSAEEDIGWSVVSIAALFSLAATWASVMTARAAPRHLRDRPTSP